LFEHGQITTTLPKAKNLRPFVEKLVTLAVRARKAREARNPTAELAARRSMNTILGDRVIVPAEHQATYDSMSDAAREKSLRMVSGRRYRTGEPKGRLAFTADSVMHRLIEKIAPRYVDRPGGYTRIIRLAKRRIGDASWLAMVQLVGDESAPGSLAKPEKSARRRRADGRYALAVKMTKKRAETAKAGASASGDVG
ncbi:MAG: 50S ribosomal protein L17, partial [Phycisphaerales bacterium]|nr:50S ribosomal protein L17 [Phycisphaerales bacterium]